MTEDIERIKKKNLLLSYYNQDDSLAAGDSNRNLPITNSSSDHEVHLQLKDPYDINSSSFEPDLFLKKLIKEKTLPEIMDFENDVAKETRRLDSEMQTLVSENYNKFISATDTIRQMRSDFKKMEDEMESLVSFMSDITHFNDKINNTFQDKRNEISRLSGINNLLKKLQFVFELPSKLDNFVENEQSFAKAVYYFTKAKKTLDHYKQMPTFKNIEDDCILIIEKLKKKLYDRIDMNDCRPNDILESVDLLSQLGEPVDQLSTKYMNRIEKSLDQDLNALKLDIDLLGIDQKNQNDKDNDKLQSAMDILEFVDHGCNNFLANLSSVIESFNALFLNKKNSDFNYSAESPEFTDEKLNGLIRAYWLKYCDLVRRRFEVEQNLGENTIIVRAVDRFYRRIQSINKQIPNVDLSVEASNIALYVAELRVNFYLQILKSHFNESLIDLRHQIALIGTSGQSDKKLQNLQDLTFKSLTEQLKNVLTNLQAFIASDISFSAKVYFNEPFCKTFVRENLLVAYLKFIAQVANEYSDGSHDPVPSALLLILCRLCLEFETVAIDYLLTLADEQFFISNKSGITNKKELIDLFRESAKLLINYYVKVRGINISQMIRKSVETRDWLNTIEPRNVRAVMKRIVEDLTSLEMQVGELFETGTRKEKGSDSSRNTFMTRQTQRSATWNFGSKSVDSKLMSNIQKLFAEKIEIFSQVDFNKMSILTGIVKITLKTFLECIRLKTFSKYGLQQIQVDCHYLQLYLWRFVNDENLVFVLLEEILNSAINRCTDAQLMESRVVELICETV